MHRCCIQTPALTRETTKDDSVAAPAQNTHPALDIAANMVEMARQQFMMHSSLSLGQRYRRMSRNASCQLRFTARRTETRALPGTTRLAGRRALPSTDQAQAPTLWAVSTSHLRQHPP